MSEDKANAGESETKAAVAGTGGSGQAEPAKAAASPDPGQGGAAGAGQSAPHGGDPAAGDQQAEKGPPAPHVGAAGQSEEGQPETAAPVSLTDIDPVAFAAASANVAAARLSGMLAGRDFNLWWFDRADQRHHMPADDFEVIESVVKDLARYVCERSASGEQLWIKAADFDLGPSTPWAELPVQTRIVWHLFAQTCLLNYRQLDAAGSAMLRAEMADATKAAPLKLADSIFDPGPSMGDLVDGWADEQRRLAQAQAAAEQDKPKKGKKGGGRRGPASAKMTVGETVPAKPVNKGGRGRRKPASKPKG